MTYVVKTWDPVFQKPIKDLQRVPNINPYGK